MKRYAISFYAFDVLEICVISFFSITVEDVGGVFAIIVAKQK